MITTVENDPRQRVMGGREFIKIFVCPTKHVLAILKAIISVVGDLHTQNCWLSPTVTFGVNTLSKHTHDYCVVEIIIDQN